MPWRRATATAQRRRSRSSAKPRAGACSDERGARALHRLGAASAEARAAGSARARTPSARAGAAGARPARTPGRLLDARARSLRRSGSRARARLGRGAGDRRGARAATLGGAAVSAAEAQRVVHEADVCVIGAGAGGAVVAAELAEGGARVVLLEQGPGHDIDKFSARPPEMLARLYRDAGQTATLGSPPILLPLGRGLGGTTLVNSGTCFRTPPALLERWAGEFGLDVDAASLAPCFERVEKAISVAEVTPELAGANALVARRGAERLGWSHGYLRRHARGCVGSGVCVFRCPTSAKQHTGIT